MRLYALDEAAEAKGLKRGQAVTEARACVPETEIMEATLAADLKFLNGLADWCERYTPLVALNGNNGLFLDITGASHLFGGEHALLDDVLNRLFHMGLDAHASIASSPGLSYALAFGAQRDVIAAGHEVEVLAGMPVEALRLDANTITAIRQAGFKTAGDLMQAPRAPLVRRFGSQLLRRLDQALAREDEPVSPRQPVASFSVERQLGEPISLEDDILELTRHLGGQLEQRLSERGMGGLGFELTLFRVDGNIARLAIRAAEPLKDPNIITGLFRDRLTAIHDDFDAGYGFETIRLSVSRTAPFAPRQHDFSNAGRPDIPLSEFAARVEARLGENLIKVHTRNASHIPERAAQMVTFDGAVQVQAIAEPHPIRPLRLFKHPEPVEAMASVPEGPPITFRWRRALHRVRRAEGPERIEAEWWIDGEEAPPRDYFRIEDEVGRRFWLYREGLYGRSAAPPRWFMHGLFA